MVKRGKCRTRIKLQDERKKSANGKQEKFTAINYKNVRLS